ncbi:S1C family serine protease [Virgibacillus sp. W0430]|uniref:S1C family serine protease n=1 Tax=Virgibacillus sp. W0430 TaxID=3391580 RepID=UPI003F47D8C5
MGYYSNQSPYRKKGGNWLIPILIGVIIGGVFVFFLKPMDSNENHSSTNEQSESTTDGPTETKNISVNVSTQITDIVEQVSPAVVGITNIQQRADFWQQQEDREAGSGSGVIYKKQDGYAYVVTNHHVIENADVIEVVLWDETTKEAELLGTDLFSDLAVLRMEDDDVDQVIEMGSSESVKVGEPAIAIGNPLGMFLGSVTQGIVSGKQRTVPQDFNQDGRADWQAEVIQTDAAINPGNSGGALINMEGQLIGINSMKINQTVAEGLGFAIPVDIARPIIQELEETGKVTRPYLGVEIYALEEVPKVEWRNTLNLPDTVKGGVYIWSVEPLTPADQAGLKRLDVITAMDGKEITDMIELRKILYQEKEVGDTVKITFYRDGEKQETTVKLGIQK